MRDLKGNPFPHPVGWTLVTARCSLRPANPSDAAALLAVAQSNDLERMARLLSDSAHWWGKHSYGLWIINAGDSAEAIGWCALRPGDSPASPELFYGLIPAMQGRGLMTEAASAVLAYALRLEGIQSVWSATRVDHHKSSAVMGRIGMLFERQADLDGIESVVYRIGRPGVERNRS